MAMGAAIDATMAGCILDLYRSATSVQDDWGPDFVDIPKPGMVVVPGDDPFLNAEGATRAAQRAGAQTARLDGVGHWWMAQDPAAAAALLEDVTDRALRSEFKPDDGAGAGVVAEAVGDQSAQRPVITGSGDVMTVTMHFHN